MFTILTEAPQKEKIFKIYAEVVVVVVVVVAAVSHDAKIGSVCQAVSPAGAAAVSASFHSDIGAGGGY